MCFCARLKDLGTSYNYTYLLCVYYRPAAGGHPLRLHMPINRHVPPFSHIHVCPAANTLNSYLQIEDNIGEDSINSSHLCMFHIPR